jgi:curved DNA-binding protein CbpA
MTDYFKLLDESRCPWLDTDLLKQKFLKLSAHTHPDKIHAATEAEKSAATGTFAELNAAYNCLAEPKARLRHFLELELGEKPKDVQEIPPLLAAVFIKVATACQNADSFLAEKSKVTSPLLQVRYFERSQEWIEQLNTLRKQIEGFDAQTVDVLKALNVKWQTNYTAKRAEVLQMAELTYQAFGFFNRWRNQIQERITRLSF